MVLEDFDAHHAQEISVQKGQTVEVLERLSAQPDWALVRALSPDHSGPVQGLVPLSHLVTSETSGKTFLSLLYFSLISCESA